ncbi:MAG: hypothetical protein QOC89_3349 [Paraburkholderia sp.]|nr:hypothetical protein [Paraburkholderia sp.]
MPRLAMKLRDLPAQTEALCVACEKSRVRSLVSVATMVFLFAGVPGADRSFSALDDGACKRSETSRPTRWFCLPITGETPVP